MATNGNREWADKEAKRRANAMGRAYVIYQNARYPEDHILKPQSFEAPPHPWKAIATIEPDKT